MPDFRMVNLRKLDPNPWQPRGTYKKGDLKSLADSIRTLGVIEPIIVRPDPDKSGWYQVAAGGRRKTASEMAGQDEIPAMVRDLDDKAMHLFSLVENEMRAPMEDVDRERAYFELWEWYYKKDARAEGDQWAGATEMAKDIGVSMQVVSGLLEAYSTRLKLRSTALTSSTDLRLVSALAKEDPKSAKKLLKAKADGLISARDLEKVAPTVRAHVTAEARIQAAEEIVKAHVQAAEFAEEVREEVQMYADENRTRTQIRHIDPKDVSRLKTIVKDAQSARITLGRNFVRGIEDLKIRARAVDAIDELSAFLAREVQFMREKGWG